jgi:purine catabolism regulator
MQDPWRWLGPDELLMTVGLCIPESEDAQRELIAQLDDAGLAGIVTGLIATAPRVSAAMIAEADARDFPLLETSAETPFAAIGRTVAAATATEQAVQVLKLSKMYHQATFAEADPRDLLTRLETLLDVGLRVVDAQTGLPIATGSSSAAPSSATPSSAAPRAGTTRTYPLPTGQGAVLEIHEPKGSELDSFLQVHLLKIVDVGVGRILAQLQQRIDERDSALQQLLNGSLPEDLNQLVKPARLSDGYRLIAVAKHHWQSISRSLALDDCATLATQARDVIVVLVPNASFMQVRELIMNLGVRAAASASFTDYRDAASAATQAGKTLLAGLGSASNWLEYEGVSVSMLSRSRDEAAEIIADVLGDLAGDEPKMVTLRETLFAFLEHDRNWADTAAALSIHRQTLSYRLGRVRDITGRNLNSSADLAACWIAFQSWRSFRDDRS